MVNACGRWTLRLISCGLIVLAARGALSQEVAVAHEEAVAFEKAGDAAADSSVVVNRLAANVQSGSQQTEAVEEFQERAGEITLLLSALTDAADRQEPAAMTREQYHRLAGLVSHLRDVAVAGQLSLDGQDIEALLGQLATLDKYYYPEARRGNTSFETIPLAPQH